ncbi:MAG: HepT-like ribonuclease domain-containing protein [Chlamydiota bacterium]
MTKDSRLYIHHILEGIECIERWTCSCDKESFGKEKMRYDAIVRNLQTITESLQRLPQNIKDLYPQIPWRDVSGFRNIIVHDYLDGIDKDILWTIITVELPVIKQVMLQLSKN